MKHLTVEQVFELRELGVEFEDTEIMWATEDNYAFLFPRRSHIRRMKSWTMLPAPNLQEVLEKLPLGFSADDEYCEGILHFWLLNVEYNGNWYISYFKENKFLTLFEKRSKDGILLAFDTLKWVAINYPKQLKK